MANPFVIQVNRELLGEKIRGGANLKALVINAEDSTDEIRRRVYAFCLAHESVAVLDNRA